MSFIQSKDAVQWEVFVSLFVSEVENLSFGDTLSVAFILHAERLQIKCRENNLTVDYTTCSLIHRDRLELLGM